MNKLYTGIEVERIKLSKEERINSLKRSSEFLGYTPRKYYKEAYKACNAETFDPFSLFLVKSEELFKLLYGTFNRKPRPPIKIKLANAIVDNIINMRGSFVESGVVHSLALQKAKEASANLNKLRANIELLKACWYVSESFYIILFNILVDLNNILAKWIEIVTFKP